MFRTTSPSCAAELPVNRDCGGNETLEITDAYLWSVFLRNGPPPFLRQLTFMVAPPSSIKIQTCFMKPLLNALPSFHFSNVSEEDSVPGHYQYEIRNLTPKCWKRSKCK
ncbi:hypothetical protein NPIL_510491 [Nephila pilipes]|uniref:Uncharacterized protein n=1 Tax=Nephila pilipes TaxID=299642 RepID=A0A8X6Q9M4_NEPPI|nr:hypothetical protein NPIL_510491 [Nephila pilipes]